MTAEQLEELLGKVTQGEWRVEIDTQAAQVTGYPVIEADGYTVVGNEGMYGDIETDFSNAVLIALAPSLARRVIAAEKLVEATGELCRRVEQQQNGWPMRADYVPNALLPAQAALTAYREARK